jgi:hypothetical protein
MMLPIAFHRTNTFTVRAYGVRAADVQRFCLALQEGEPRLSCRGLFQDPLKWLYYAEVNFGEAPDLYAELPPVDTFYGNADVQLVMERAGVRMVHLSNDATHVASPRGATKDGT